MRKDVQAYIAGCQVCQRVKPASSPQANPLNPLPVLTTLWDHVSLDLIGPLPESRGYNAIVTIADIASKGIKPQPATISISTGGAARVMRD
jgi:hypothetical protein